MTNHTNETTNLLIAARAIAQSRGEGYVGVEHLLLALLDTPIFQRLFLDCVPPIREYLRKECACTDPNHQMPYTPRVKKVLALASREANQMGHGYVNPEHVLLGLLLENGGAAGAALSHLTIGADGMYRRVKEELTTKKDSPMKTIDYMIEVMQAARDGKQIEYRLRGPYWEPTSSPLWNWDMIDYRIAPDPFEEALERYAQGEGVTFTVREAFKAGWNAAQEYYTKDAKN